MTFFSIFKNSTKTAVAEGSESFQGLKWSLIGHILFLLLFSAQSLIFPNKIPPYIPTLRVDLVGLPDILKKDLYKIKPGLPAEEVLELEEEIKLSQTPVEKTSKEIGKTSKKEAAKTHQQADVAKQNKRALDRIRAISKIQESLSDRKIIKGNKVSPGTSLSGEAKEATEVHYFDSVRERLKQNWELPAWISRQKRFTAQVQIRIDAQGNLREFHFLKESGSPQFDEAVKRTLQESQPFPIPPNAIQASVLLHGIEVGFPL
jgi:TonB family protein